MTPVAKVCRHCGEVKLTDDFTRQSGTSDGLASWCKSCFSEYAAERRKRLGIPKQNPLISTVRHAKRDKASYLVYDPETGLYHSPKDFT
jgi:hypothetical protein